MITLYEYLKLRNSGKTPALTMAEANVIGIKYPLQKHWVRKHGNKKLSDQEVIKMLEALKQRKIETNTLYKRQIKAQKSRELCLKYGWVPQDNQPTVGILNKPKHGSIKNPKIDSNKGKITFAQTDSFLNSFEWRKVRMMAIKKYGAKCMCCGATPATGAVINVDHIKPRKLWPSLALDINNLQILCHDCNHGKGNWDMTDWRSQELQKV